MSIGMFLCSGYNQFQMDGTRPDNFENPVLVRQKYGPAIQDIEWILIVDVNGRR